MKVGSLTLYTGSLRQGCPGPAPDYGVGDITSSLLPRVQAPDRSRSQTLFTQASRGIDSRDHRKSDPRRPTPETPTISQQGSGQAPTIGSGWPSPESRNSGSRDRLRRPITLRRPPRVRPSRWPFPGQTFRDLARESGPSASATASPPGAKRSTTTAGTSSGEASRTQPSSRPTARPSGPRQRPGAAGHPTGPTPAHLSRAPPSSATSSPLRGRAASPPGPARARGRGRRSRPPSGRGGDGLAPTGPGVGRGAPGAPLLVYPHVRRPRARLFRRRRRRPEKVTWSPGTQGDLTLGQCAPQGPVGAGRGSGRVDGPSTGRPLRSCPPPGSAPRPDAPRLGSLRRRCDESSRSRRSHPVSRPTRLSGSPRSPSFSRGSTRTPPSWSSSPTGARL